MDRLSYKALQSLIKDTRIFHSARIQLIKVQITFTSDQLFHVNKQITGIT